MEVSVLAHYAEVVERSSACLREAQQAELNAANLWAGDPKAAPEYISTRLQRNHAEMDELVALRNYYTASELGRKRGIAL